MAANYRSRRPKRLKQADSGAKQDVKQSNDTGDAITKKIKNLRKRVDFPRIMFYYNDVLKRKTKKKEVMNYDN